MKKSLVLVLVVLLSFFAVYANGASETTSSTEAENKEPVVVNFWHSLNVGANADTLNEIIEDFNNTIGKEEGIVVVGTYQGGYTDIKTKVLASLAAGEEVAQIIQGERSNNIPTYWDEGILCDMTEYIENSDVIDMDNFVDALTGFSYSPDGEIISLPFIRTTFNLFYNKDLFTEAGYPEPQSWADIEAAAKAITKVSDNGTVLVSGLCFHHDFSVEYPICAAIGSEVISDEGTNPVMLTDGSMLELLTWWKRGIDEGWISKYPTSNSSSVMSSDLFNGRIGAFLNSAANTGSYVQAAKELGFNLGVVSFPAWYNGVRKVPLSGTNIAMIAASNSKEQLDAAWRFIEFLESDEQVTKIAKTSGCVVSTKSAAESDEMQAYWAENPEYKVGYEGVLNYGCELPFSLYKPNLPGCIKAPLSALILEGKGTPESAVAQMVENASKQFPKVDR